MIKRNGEYTPVFLVRTTQFPLSDHPLFGDSAIELVQEVGIWEKDSFQYSQSLQRNRILL
jgi:hypothetical protein